MSVRDAVAPALRERDFAKAFVAMMLCSIASGAVAGGAVGFVSAAVAMKMGYSPDDIRGATSIVAAGTGIALTYVFFRFFVRRFIVRKLVSEAAQSPTA